MLTWIIDFSLRNRGLVILAAIACAAFGVVGLAIAERLVAEGRHVVIVDPGTPGMGASYGNASRWNSADCSRTCTMSALHTPTRTLGICSSKSLAECRCSPCSMSTRSASVRR